MSNEGEPYYTRERFKKDPRAQKLMRQFMHSAGEGGGAGRSEEFRAGYAYAFELDDAQRRAVDELRATKPDMELKDAILEILNSAQKEQAMKTFDLVAHLHRQRAFSEKTFGPGARSKGVVEHIRKELLEIESDPTDVEEWVDVVLLALDGAWRAGWTPEEIATVLDAKQTKNERRSWPDWRTASHDKAIEHVKAPCPDCARNGGECSRHNLDDR